MKKKLTIKKNIIAFISMLFIGVVGFIIYASDYYGADQTAIDYYEKDSRLIIEHNQITIPSSSDKTTAFIFYPGAKVEYIAYLPLFEKLNDETDMMVVMLKMPLNFAFLGMNAADKIIEANPEIDEWIMVGHSLGGAMASSYASNHQDEIVALIVLGAYVYGDYPIEQSLTIYGSLNTSVEEKLTYDENIVEIMGGNHAQFGNYGFQKGDSTALISAEEQQNQTVQAIVDFIQK